MRSNRNYRRIISILICAIMIFIISASLYFVALEANHHCSNPACGTCAAKKLSEHTIAQFGADAVKPFAAVIAAGTIIMTAALRSFDIRIFTPVAAKVRMDD